MGMSGQLSVKEEKSLLQIQCAVRCHAARTEKERLKDDKEEEERWRKALARCYTLSASITECICVSLLVHASLFSSLSPFPVSLTLFLFLSLCFSFSVP